jgi:hypothetical protein
VRTCKQKFHIFHWKHFTEEQSKIWAAMRDFATKRSENLSWNLECANNCQWGHMRSWVPKWKCLVEGKKNVMLDQNKEAEIYIFTSKIMVENWHLGKLYSVIFLIEQNVFPFSRRIHCSFSRALLHQTIAE